MKKYPDPVRFYPLNPIKYVGNVNNIIMRSSWESKFALWADTNPHVLKWGSEIKAIPYFSTIDKRVRRYFPDFWIMVENKEGGERKLIIEIKPKSQTCFPKSKKKSTLLQEIITWQKNQDKWQAAREWAKKYGFEFVVMTEYDLGIAK